MSETILVIDDEEAQREALAGYLRKRGYGVLVAASGQAGVEALRTHAVDLVLTDLRLPDLDGIGVLREARQLNPEIEVVMVTAYGSVGGAVEAMKGGAFHYLEKPVDLDELDVVVRRALERHHLVSENRMLRARLQERASLAGLVSVEPAMEEALNVAARAAPSRATVLIQGESGTGKELVARAIHAASPRRERPFVAVNCAALNENLVESEIFGHEKGAFTGATQTRRGRFEQADGGTLFIDEVAEIPPGAQVKLLRVLQERTFERVGGETPVQVDVRLVSATNRSLEELVRQGRFREDLLYRLKVVTVSLPPLRARRGDIPALVDHFLGRYAEENGKAIQGVSREAMELLMRHAYPGNVRELQNVMERAVVMARGEVVTAADLPAEMGAGPAASGSGSLTEQVESLERAAIAGALEQAGGVQSRAAGLLGITERNLRYKLRKYGLR
ncbi:MAG: sigma-54 dependent transcriptional regulator [Candidatus Latescibacterota bacterium]